jgi:exonuclease SbcD
LDFEGKEAERAREHDSVLAKAVDFALEPRNRIDLVLIAGDLFETHRPSPRHIEEAIRQLGRLVAAGIAVVTTPGNHDEITYTASVYRTEGARWPGVLVREPMPARVATLLVRKSGAGGGLPVHVYSLAYTGGVTACRPALTNFPHTAESGVHLAVFHGSLGLGGMDAGDRSLPLDSGALAAAGYDYVALGHFHRFSEQDLRPGAAASRDPGAAASREPGAAPRTVKAVYPGPVDSRGFSDPGEGAFVVATVSPGGKATVTRHPVPIRKCRVVEIDVTAMATPEALDRAFAALAEREGREAIVRVRLTGAAAFIIDRDSLAARHRDRFYHLQLAGEPAFLAQADIARWSTEPTVRGEFIRRLLERQKHAVDEREAAVLRRALTCGLRALSGGER